MADEDLVMMLCAKSRRHSTRTASMSTLHVKESERLHNVGVLQGLVPGKVSELCLMHLSRLLDLDGDKFQALAMKNKAPSRKPFLGSPFRKKYRPVSHVDGVPTESVSHIYRLITFLSKPQIIKEEGLFRKTGNISRQRFLKEWLLSRCEDLSMGCCSPNHFTAHDCANVLKTLLAELPNPLLTERHFEAYRQANEFKARGLPDASRRQLKVVQLLMLLLPRENVVLVELLMSLLYQVCQEPSNKMTATALATMFAPHLLCSRKLDPEEFQKEAAIATEAVTFMIEHAPDLFKVPPELDRDIHSYLDTLKIESDDGQLTPLSTPKGKAESPVHTVVAYACQVKSEDSNANSDTQVALAELYAHMQSMPECSQKKKLLRKFNHNVLTPQSKGKHTRSKTLGSSLKKLKNLSGFSRHKHLLSISSDEGTPWGLIPIGIEEQVTDGATIITCKNTLAARSSSSMRSLITEDDVATSSSVAGDAPTPRGRRQKRQQQIPTSGDCTPPKQDCKETEHQESTPSCSIGSRGKANSKCKLRESPLPCSENEISYLQVDLHQEKLPLYVRQLAVSPVKLRNRICRSPKDPCSRRAQSLVLSPTTLETSL
ncbi:rho GTPase-activating protein 19-like [Pomacea canaliculata]|uniref:rho GTPase-activating protein 19-like n=1 Tax=Pomacea canaliculata TaxID=400727 RepID=UPI000D730543|nr:rho GTPase-activating protein 19-like [Pomacea canaliculata]